MIQKKPVECVTDAERRINVVLARGSEIEKPL
jgi:hypothetical protein